MGKRIVITTLGSLGDIHPYLALAVGLKERKHEPILATSPYYRSTIEKAGIGFYPVRPDVDPQDATLAPQILHPLNGPEFLIRKIILPHLRDSYADLWNATEGADLLVTHPITYAGPLVAQKRTIPWVSTVLAPMSFFSAHDLPVFPGLTILVKLRLFGPAMSRLLLKFTKTFTRTWSKPIDALRKEVGLSLGRDPIYEGQFSSELNLALFSKVLATPQPDWPLNTRVTGYPFYENTEASLAPEIERFLASGSPPVVFTLGTSAAMAPGRFYEESVNAAKKIGVRALLLVGKQFRNVPDNLPEGIMAFDYAPYSLVFPHAAAIVHQGGIGTTSEALRAGCPMLVVPFAFDQPDNAFRVTQLGVARTLYPSRYTAKRVVKNLRILMEDQDYTERAFQVGNQVKSENGVQEACNAIVQNLRE
jgi:rhamnosyltransferase subunit B